MKRKKITFYSTITPHRDYFEVQKLKHVVSLLLMYNSQHWNVSLSEGNQIDASYCEKFRLNFAREHLKSGHIFLIHFLV